jgi:RND family efflux transporter MFP subunit
VRAKGYLWLVLAAAAVCVVLWLVFSAGRRSREDTQRLAASSPDTTARAIVYTCSMHPQVLRNEPGVCPICNMKLVPIPGARAAGKQPALSGRPGALTPSAQKKERKIAYYWDPMMNPPYISKKPGKSPMGMELVPVYEDQIEAGLAVTIDPVVIQNMGIRVATVVEGPLTDVIRTVGYLRTAQPNQYDVTLKVGGYIERLYADTEGALVQEEAPLFELYSPELLVAEEELLAAKSAFDSLPPSADETLRSQARGLLENVRRRLDLWDVPAREIERLLESGRTSRVVTFRSPVTGFVVEKKVVSGAYVMAGQKILRIDDLSVLWLDAQVYEDQLAYVAIGQRVAASIEGLPKKSFSGRVVFIDPEVSPETRTATARLAFENPGFALKPGMFANVNFSVLISTKTLRIPRAAMIDTGTRQIVFLAHSGGHFEPRVVRPGAETVDGVVQILEGLAPGDTVVTSGQFLLDTESRTREAIEKMSRENLLIPPEKSGAPLESEGSRSDAPLGPGTPVQSGASLQSAPPLQSGALRQSDTLHQSGPGERSSKPNRHRR